MKVTKQDYQRYHEYPTKELRDKLIIANIGLVKLIAKSFEKTTEFKKEELEGYGYEALIKSIDLFDPTLENQFSTYAGRAIEHRIMSGIGELRGYRKNDNDHVNFYNRLYELKQITKDTIDDYDTMCNIVFAELDLDPEVERKIRIRLSLNSEEPTPQQVEVSDTDEFFDPTFMLTEYNNIEQMINQAVSELRITHQTILKKRYGLQNETPITGTEFGKEYNLRSPYHYEKKALKALRWKIGWDNGQEMLQSFKENYITPAQLQKIKR